MSVKLVTLDQAKEHLNYDHDADDLRLEDAIEDASRRVLDYINRSPQLIGYTDVDGELLTNAAGDFRAQQVDSSGALFDTNGEPLMESWPSDVAPRPHPSLRRATLLVLSNFDERSQDDPISDAVKSALGPIKDPTLA